MWKKEIVIKERPKAGHDASPARQGWVMDTKTAQGLKARNTKEPKESSQLHGVGLSALPDLLDTPPSPSSPDRVGGLQTGLV